MTKDPVCGMLLSGERAAAEVVHAGRKYLFCSDACRERFERDPQRFAEPSEHGGEKR